MGFQHGKHHAAKHCIFIQLSLWGSMANSSATEKYLAVDSERFKGNSDAVSLNELIFLAHVAKNAYGETSESSKLIDRCGFSILPPEQTSTDKSGSRQATIDAAKLTAAVGEQTAARSSTQLDILVLESDRASDRVAIVAFRGSEPYADDWTIDLDILPTEGQGEVTQHRGFDAALDVVWGELCRHLINGSFAHLWITGHSLGGALAVLTSYRLATATDESLRKLASTLHGVVTFGQPRVGDWRFASDYEQLRTRDDDTPLGLKTFRVVNKDDVVPRMPPPQMGFRHAGRTLYIAADGLLAEIDSDDQRLLDRLSAGVQMLKKGEIAGIRSHSMDAYITALRDRRNQYFTPLKLECLSARQVIWNEIKHLEITCPGSTSDPDFPVGLALSGGGIRSATFNLGLLQALANCRIGNASSAQPSLLHQIDYLSTVSGGGYIGSWLSAWSLGARIGITGCDWPLASATSPYNDSGEPPEITWLRRFSNYLTPRTGPFSADTLTGVATWLRNTLLNQTVLVIFLVCVVLVIWGLTALGEIYIESAKGSHTRLSYLSIFWTIVVATGGVVGRSQAKTADVGDTGSGSISRLATAILALGTIGLFAALSPIWSNPMKFSAPRVVVLTPILAMSSLFIITTIGAAVMAKADGEQAREWLARANARWIYIAVFWGVAATLALYASFAFDWLGNAYAALGGAVWFATTAIGLFSALSSRTGGEDQSGWKQWPARIAPYIFMLGVVGLVAQGVHSGLQYVSTISPSDVTNTCPHQHNEAGWEPSHRITNDGDQIIVEQKSFATYCEVVLHERNIIAVVRHVEGIQWLVIFFVLGVFVVLLGHLVNINTFSFHYFYRNRLERCYLGACNRRRSPNSYTGLDPKDSPNLNQLAAGQVRPYHLINTCLNLTYEPEDRSEFLGWQERKGASFLLSPLFCGYRLAFGTRGVNAYQETAMFGQGKNGNAKGIGLGMAMTISGAAANPNWGYHSNPATAFLLTLFNVRLGWWMQNPRKWDAWRKGEPSFSVWLLLQEVLGESSDDDNYVNLSDGGHFENLGIYELVRRRCKVIFASDAGADPSYSFEDLGNAVRKCRTDFGVDIEIDPRAIIPGPDGLSLHHCAVGIIRYPETPEEPASQGQLLYIKSSLSGDEPSDILQYKAQHPDFPQQSTADQWFDESQFESYRKLGEHIGNIVICKEAQRNTRATSVNGDVRVPRDMLVDLLDRLWRRWHRPSPFVAAAMSRHSESLDTLLTKLRESATLAPLDRELNADWNVAVSASVASIPVTREVIYFCANIFQLMEEVYLDLNLEEDYRHPDVQGWMNLFRQWARSKRVLLGWAVFGQTYGSRFRDFCESHLGFPVPKPLLTEDVSVTTPRWLLPNAAADFEAQRRSWPPEAIVDVREFRLNIAEETLEFGYAVVQRKSLDQAHDALLAFWLRPHLRGIGLGRRAALALRTAYPGIRYHPGIGGNSGRPLRDVLRSANIFPTD